MEYSRIISHSLSPLEQRFRDIQIVILTNFVVILSVSMMRVDCICFLFILCFQCKFYKPLMLCNVISTGMLIQHLQNLKKCCHISKEISNGKEKKNLVRYKTGFGDVLYKCGSTDNGMDGPTNKRQKTITTLIHL